MENKNNKTIIIAEAGVNHNGSLKVAKKLIDKAKKAKVDFVKFQIYKAENLATSHAEKAKYQKRNSKKKETQLNLLKKLELSFKDHSALIKYCKIKKIKYMASIFDLESLSFFKNKLNIIKIPSGEITNFVLLAEIAKLKKKIILSTGASTIKEISSAFKFLLKKKVKKNNLSILHCNSEYPLLDMRDINLRAIDLIKKKFNVNVGYSDHTLGIEISIAAVACGAKIIEKHFTLNKNQKGPDHSSSIEPQELIRLVQSIRNVEAAMGKKEKNVSNSERKNLHIIRKSLVAKRNINKGEKFSLKNVTTKRPGNGISPINFIKVFKKKAKKNFFKDQLIKI